jgi:hypothetical protein
VVDHVHLQRLRDVVHGELGSASASLLKCCYQRLMSPRSQQLETSSRASSTRCSFSGKQSSRLCTRGGAMSLSPSNVLMGERSSSPRSSIVDTMTKSNMRPSPSSVSFETLCGSRFMEFALLRNGAIWWKSYPHSADGCCPPFPG